MRKLACQPKPPKGAKAGGAEGDRTPDLLIANEALSQLSYGPFRAGGTRVPGPWEGCHLGPGSRTVKDRPWIAPGRACLGQDDPVNVRVANVPDKTDMRPLLEVIIYLLWAYWYIVIAAVILSWLIAFNVVNTRNQIVAMIADFLYRLTEPVFRPIRQFMPNLGGIDFSPLIVLLILYVIERSIVLYIYPNVF